MYDETAQAIAVVEEFCAAWSSLDYGRIGGFFADGVVYRNGPAAPVVGRDGVTALLERMGRGLERCEFVIVGLAAAGSRVFTERADRVRYRGVDAVLDVAGVFEVEGGRLASWREYFDLAEHLAAMGITPRPDS